MSNFQNRIFDGISPEGLFLLAQNRFEDSKDFYEAHKLELKKLVLAPMGQIVEALQEQFSMLDPQMLLIPSRIVSRLRRDTRFTHDKTLYRANVWVCFSRQRVEYPHIWPILWFEIKPEEGVWNAGIGLWDHPPVYMRHIREAIISNSDDFLHAIQQAIAAGAQLHTDPYQKDRAPDAPEALKPYLNAKSFHIMVTSDDMQLLQSDTLISQLQQYYTNYAPIYHWLRQNAELYIEKQEL